MSSPKNRLQARELPVLRIGVDRVEWLDRRPRSSVGYLSATVEEPSPVRLAVAAARLLREHKIRPGACVIALGHGMLEERQLKLTEMSAGELRKVLWRKAANLLECSPSNALYSAVPLEIEEGATTREWLLVAMKRSAALALQLELRRLGFRPRRIVSTRLANVAAAAGLADDGEAVIAVGAGTQAVTVSLIHGHELVQQSRLAGSLERTPTLATALLQEIRSFEAYWRRRSRGAELARVVTIGLDPASAAQLAPGIQACLPGTNVACLPDVGDAREDAARIAALATCLATGPFQLDLTLPMPPRAATLAVVAVLMTSAAGIVGWEGRHRLLTQHDEQLDQTSLLRAQAADVAQLDANHAAIQSGLVALDSERARIAAVDIYGLNTAPLIADTLAAFQSRGTLLSLTVDGTEEGGSVTLTGVTAPDPARSLQSLRGLVSDLSATPYYTGLVLSPPTGMPRVDSTGAGESLLDFSIQGSWRSSR